MEEDEDLGRSIKERPEALETDLLRSRGRVFTVSGASSNVSYIKVESVSPCKLVYPDT